MARIYNRIILSVTLCLASIYAEESNGEVLNYEYVQIFSSIPALFEYLLEMLEERPEILEKNDISVFKRNREMKRDTSDHIFMKRYVDADTVHRDITTITESSIMFDESNKYKRGADSEITDDDNTDENFTRRKSNSNSKFNARLSENESNDGKIKKTIKRDSTISESTRNDDNDKNMVTTEREYSTVLHEYGRSNYISATDANKYITQIEKREIVNNNRIDKNLLGGFKRNHVNFINANKIKDTVKRKPNHDSQMPSRIDTQYFTEFKRLDRSLLTSEEIENQMIKVEQILEEHNNKKKIN